MYLFKKSKGPVTKGLRITAQNMKFCIKDFFRECDQIRSFLEKSESHLLKKSLRQNFTFCAANVAVMVTLGFSRCPSLHFNSFDLKVGLVVGKLIQIIQFFLPNNIYS